MFSQGIMNIVDIILLLIILLALWGGWVKGFIFGIADLLVWVGSLLAGFFLYKIAADSLYQILPSLGSWRLPLAFVAVIILTRIFLSLLFNPILYSTPVNAHRSVLNRMMGLVPGFVQGLIYATLVSALLLALPISDTISATTRNSTVAGRLASQVEWLDSKFSPIFGEAAKQTMNRLTVKPESDETVELRFTVENPEARPDLEAKMLDLVNQERVKRGLQPLQPDPEMTAVARAHSKDMFARGYFSHYTPEKKDPFDRMKAAGVNFTTAGENLALGQTLQICHTGLMNSPGHRANILNQSFGRLGIGILDGGFHGLMISQEFRN